MHKSVMFPHHNSATSLLPFLNSPTIKGRYNQSGIHLPPPPRETSGSSENQIDRLLGHLVVLDNKVGSEE